MWDHLHFLLTSLDGVRQDPRHHPEGDALFHSLQVFEWALRESQTPELRAAALFHDIGKAISVKDHAAIGADDLDGLLPPRAVWLVRHHMDLLYNPKRTRKLYRGTGRLHDLELLRRCDVRGRDPHARVMSADDAIDLLMHQHPQLHQPSGDAARNHDDKELA